MLHLGIYSLLNSLIINGLHKVLYRRCACVSVRLTLQIREPEDRFTNLSDFFQKSCLSTPSHLTVTAPAGHAASLSLRRHLHCFGFPDGNLADAPVRPWWALATASNPCYIRSRLNFSLKIHLWAYPMDFFSTELIKFALDKKSPQKLKRWKTQFLKTGNGTS